MCSVMKEKRLLMMPVGRFLDEMCHVLMLEGPGSQPTVLRK